MKWIPQMDRAAVGVMHFLNSSLRQLPLDNISKTLLSGKPTSESLSIEMNIASSSNNRRENGELPPIWVEIHHKTESILRELTEISIFIRDKLSLNIFLS